MAKHGIDFHHLPDLLQGFLLSSNQLLVELPLLDLGDVGNDVLEGAQRLFQLGIDILDRLRNLFQRREGLFHFLQIPEFGGELFRRGEKLVKRGIQETDRYRKPFHGLENALEIGLLQREKLCDRVRSFLLSIRPESSPARREGGQRR